MDMLAINDLYQLSFSILKMVKTEKKEKKEKKH